MLFSANLLASTEKTNQNPREITTKIYNKPMLTEHK